MGRCARYRLEALRSLQVEGSCLIDAPPFVGGKNFSPLQMNTESETHEVPATCNLKPATRAAPVTSFQPQ